MLFTQEVKLIDSKTKLEIASTDEYESLDDIMTALGVAKLDVTVHKDGVMEMRNFKSTDVQKLFTLDSSDLSDKAKYSVVIDFTAQDEFVICQECSEEIDREDHNAIATDEIILKPVVVASVCK